eukprot:CAMPEP_0185785416 /NCGR_PEP_ID=MMETSP1174-20130828/129509_1 /TAXON_ID=35687 /ORGANISM="Dictyocha speculum, Strain CCMP1381" /LENGTH=43 /DNA_ID= /DNA_START= /DNA_END= /DNA_ORIENTATION=
MQKTTNESPVVRYAIVQAKAPPNASACLVAAMATDDIGNEYAQ